MAKATKKAEAIQLTEAEKQAAQKEEAARIADELGLVEVFLNSKGEFFTSKNLALLSENGAKNKVITFDFSSIKAEEDGEPAGEDGEKYALTEEDLAAFPKLVEQGLKVGDLVDTKPTTVTVNQ